MTKTPEQLAADYVQAWWGPREDNMTLATRQSFMAGYQAAKESNSPVKPDGCNSSNNSNGWISVMDRLPENDNEVLIVASGEVTTAFYEAGDFGWSYGTTGYETTITHWMPLPKPPTEE
jgi:hypothetical protein